MNSQGILDYRLPADIITGENIEEILCQVLETLECMKDH